MLGTAAHNGFTERVGVVNGCAVCGVLAITFIGVTCLEIFLLVEVGNFIGAWPTFGLVLATGVAGAALARSQGVAVLTKLQQSISRGEGTGNALVEGALVLAAGVTLLSPGFVTDAIGLALLIGPIRKRVATAIAPRLAKRAGAVVMGGFPGPTSAPPGDDDEDEDPPPPGVIDV